ncbi:unnamed protein product [Ceratitis capitata]|uniref:(Mediterranean fruit fly) hypothetical protein n=1 Tax=Ceratitis capitata TaxID=7213 RepID=A0A811U363_CERCA|nr:unnamed protein product [Ceratitis capitata]
MGDPSNVLYARRAELMEQKENAKILEGRTRMRVENSTPALSRSSQSHLRRCISNLSYFTLLVHFHSKYKQVQQAQHGHHKGIVLHVIVFVNSCLCSYTYVLYIYMHIHIHMYI